MIVVGAQRFLRASSLMPSIRPSGSGLLVEQSGDRPDDVAHVLAGAVVSGERSPVLQMGDPMLDADAPGRMRMALLSEERLLPRRRVLLELPMWRCHDPPAGLGPEPLIPGIGEHGRIALGGRQIG
jgi:hypothetical protein